MKLKVIQIFTVALVVMSIQPAMAKKCALHSQCKANNSGIGGFALREILTPDGRTGNDVSNNYDGPCYGCNTSSAKAEECVKNDIVYTGSISKGFARWRCNTGWNDSWGSAGSKTIADFEPCTGTDTDEDNKNTSCPATGLATFDDPHTILCDASKRNCDFYAENENDLCVLRKCENTKAPAHDENTPPSNDTDIHTFEEEPVDTDATFDTGATFDDNDYTKVIQDLKRRIQALKQCAGMD